MPKKIILLAGPTASGKSKLAIKLAKKLKGEIINADSMQTYKEFSTLSSRPSKKDENNAVIKINKTLNLINIMEDIDNPKRAFLELVLIARNTISKLIIMSENFSKYIFFALLNSNKVKGNNVVNQTPA